MPPPAGRMDDRQPSLGLPSGANPGTWRTRPPTASFTNTTAGAGAPRHAHRATQGPTQALKPNCLTDHAPSWMTLRRVLVELTMTEQRYRAVLEVEAGVPVTEVAERFGVSRQAVHRWIGWDRRLGLDGLGGRSSRPRTSPVQTPPEWRRRSASCAEIIR